MERKLRRRLDLGFQRREQIQKGSHKEIKGFECFLRIQISDCVKGWLEEALAIPKPSSFYPAPPPKPHIKHTN